MNSSDTNLENQNTKIKNSEKSNKGLIVLLILIILGLGNYIIYDKIIMKNNSDKMVENKEEDKNVNIENGKDDGELEKLAQKLYKKISVKDLHDNPMLFFKNNVNYKDFDNWSLFHMIFKIDDLKKINNDNYLGYETCVDDIEHNNKECYIFKVAKKDFEDKYKEFFGSDKTISYKTVTTDTPLNHLTAICEFKNAFEVFEEDDYLVAYDWQCGDAGWGYSDYIEYDNSKYDGEDIIISVKFLRYNWNGLVYADPDETVEVANNISQTEADANIFEIYGEKAGTFEVRFKKDINNNYYWYESKFIR